MEKSRARGPLQRLSVDPYRHKNDSHKSRYKTDSWQDEVTGDFISWFWFPSWPTGKLKSKYMTKI